VRNTSGLSRRQHVRGVADSRPEKAKGTDRGTGNFSRRWSTSHALRGRQRPQAQSPSGWSTLPVSTAAIEPPHQPAGRRNGGVVSLRERLDYRSRRDNHWRQDSMRLAIAPQRNSRLNTDSGSLHFDVHAEVPQTPKEALFDAARRRGARGNLPPRSW